jgi:hypothetical protein
MANIGIPLFHGTSTIFLEGIARHGLGGHDPVKQLRVVECARRLLPLAEAHSHRSKILENRLVSFGLMAEQVAGGLNYQHGQAYLTPSRSKAIGYACHKKRGSEIITYTLDVADELIRLNVDAAVDEIANEFSDLFNLLDVAATPVLITVSQVEEIQLLSEHGQDPKDNLTFVRNCIEHAPDSYQQICQQHNFRLIAAIPLKHLKTSLILAKKYEIVPKDYELLELDLTKLSV